jgi:hypothetical protein
MNLIEFIAVVNSKITNLKPSAFTIEEIAIPAGLEIPSQGKQLLIGSLKVSPSKNAGIKPAKLLLFTCNVATEKFAVGQQFLLWE